MGAGAHLPPAGTRAAKRHVRPVSLSQMRPARDPINIERRNPAKPQPRFNSEATEFVLLVSWLRN